VELKKGEWNNSYKNKDNFVFYPHEEIIRFISKYIRKRICINQFKDITNMTKGLDLGCGIGRHVMYLDDMNFEAYGIDLSDEAINLAKEWCEKLGKHELKNRLVVGTVTNMPYEDNFFDFVISHGVLDSMTFDIAKEAIEDTCRVMKKEGLLYFDVVSGCDYEHYREYDGEEIVETEHENGTIQSYFNWNKINLLIGDKFKIKECFLIQRESIISKAKNSRYHIVAQKM